MRHTVSSTALPVLDKLAHVVGVEYCKYCCFPQDECLCASLTAGSRSLLTVLAPLGQSIYTSAFPAGKAQLATSSLAPAPGYLFPPPGLTTQWSTVPAQIPPQGAQNPVQAFKAGCGSTQEGRQPSSASSTSCHTGSNPGDTGSSGSPGSPVAEYGYHPGSCQGCSCTTCAACATSTYTREAHSTEPGEAAE